MAAWYELPARELVEGMVTGDGDVITGIVGGTDEVRIISLQPAGTEGVTGRTVIHRRPDEYVELFVDDDSGPCKIDHPSAKNIVRA